MAAKWSIKFRKRFANYQKEQEIMLHNFKHLPAPLRFSIAIGFMLLVGLGLVFLLATLL